MYWVRVVNCCVNLLASPILSLNCSPELIWIAYMLHELIMEIRHIGKWANVLELWPRSRIFSNSLCNINNLYSFSVIKCVTFVIIFFTICYAVENFYWILIASPKLLLIFATWKFCLFTSCFSQRIITKCEFIENTWPFP